MRIRLTATKDAFGKPLSSVAYFLSKVNEAAFEEVLEVDFQTTAFVHPACVLPLAAAINYYRELGINFRLSVPAGNRYLHSIGFGNGPVDAPLGSSKIRQLPHKTYVPITCFRAGTHDADTRAKNSAIKAICTILHTAGVDQNIVYGVNYILSELTDNIQEHSFSQFGYLMAQLYPKKQFMDICLADTGVTFLGSYARNLFDEVRTDTDALTYVLRQRSVKDQDDGRGFGIRTSRNMVVKGLEGRMVFWSGAAYNQPGNNPPAIVETSSRYRFPGTVVLLRVHTNVRGFIPSEYYE